MAPISVAQTSFVGGEWSPSLHARTKLAKYYTAVRTMRNFLIHPHGPTSNRPGTRFIAEIPGVSIYTRLIPFTFSVTQTYILEFSALRMRVYKDGGIVTEGDKTITGATQADPVVITAVAHGYADGDEVIITEVGGMTELNGKTFRVANKATDTFELKDLDNNDIDGTGYGAYTSGGVVNKIYEIATLYAATHLARLKFEQSADVLYINHPSYPERQITRTGHAAWTIADTVFGAGIDSPANFARSAGSDSDHTYGVTAVTVDGKESLLSSSATGGPGCTFGWGAANKVITAATKAAPVVITSNGHGYSDGDWIIISGVVGMTELNGKFFIVDDAAANTFSLNDVNGNDIDGTGYSTYTSDGVANKVVEGVAHYNFYELKNGVFGWLGYAGTNSFVVPTLLNPDMAATPPLLGDHFGSANNYPGVSAFHEQRLIRARTNNNPQTFRGSVTGDFDNMNASSPLREDDAYDFTISANEVNEIRWLVSLKSLLIGTADSIWEASAGPGNAISFFNISLARRSAIGVADILPIPVGNSILFVSYSGERVYDLFYSYEDDGFRGNDLIILASHILKDDPIVDWCYQRHPDSTLWCVKENGDLVGLTYFKEHEVWGWHRHDTDGTFEATARISTSDGVDEVYFVVRRVIDGTERRFVEKLEERLPNEDIKDAFFVDCGLSYDDPTEIKSISLTYDPPITKVVIEATGGNFSNGDLVDIEGVVGTTEINDLRFVAADAGVNGCTLKDEAGDYIDGAAYTTYISGGNIRKAATTISGLEHLEGEAVAVLADGGVVADKTVASGAITLATAASRVHVGLPYVSDLETLDFELPTEEGSTVQDRLRDVVSIVLRLENTSALWAGPDADKIEEIGLEDDPLFDGDKEVIIASGEEREDHVFLRNVDPTPVTVTAIIARIEYGDN